MKTKLIKIGNSQGIRIPKVLIEESGLSGEVEIRVRRKSLVIEPVEHPREGWEEAFREMARRGDDELLDPETLDSEFDTREWEW